MKRILLAAALVLAAASACSGGSSTTTTVGQQPSATPTPTAAACTPSAIGTKDLKKKPVFTVTKTPAPAETTTTDIVCGTGDAAKSGDSVTVQYVGVDYATGKQFDASWDRGQPFQFDVGGNVIPGFSKGVTGMQVGGRRLVVIPPKDGYGDQGPVPGGTLAFIIDLIKIG